MTHRFLAMLGLAVLLAPHAAQAAESYDNCTGFIDSVPATISTQGVWCLRKDLSTGLTDVAAITVANNNITIDCNGFKLGGLAAGPDSQAFGVLATFRLNATVRNCAIRGFRIGVNLLGADGGGHLVEDNRIDQSLSRGVEIQGAGNLVQRNRVFDTGSGLEGVGIAAQADIRDNSVEGVVGASATGILSGGAGTQVRGNRIRNILPTTAGEAYGIWSADPYQYIVDNRLMGASGAEAFGRGISGVDANTVCRDNLISQFVTGIDVCQDAGGNVVH